MTETVHNITDLPSTPSTWKAIAKKVAVGTIATAAVLVVTNRVLAFVASRNDAETPAS